MALQNQSNSRGGASRSSTNSQSIEVAQLLLTKTIPIVWESLIGKMIEPNFQTEVTKVIRENNEIKKITKDTGLNEMQVQWLAVQTISALTKSIASGTGVKIPSVKPDSYLKPETSPKVTASPKNTVKKPAVTKLKPNPEVRPQQQAQFKKSSTKPKQVQARENTQNQNGFFDKLNDFSFEELDQKYELKDKSEKIASTVGDIWSGFKRKASLAYEAIKEDNQNSQNNRPK